MEKVKIRSVRDLRVWQVGMELSISCYRLTKGFPSDERYGLISQIRRASVSVPANIAEGYGRGNPGDNHRHLSIAQGSLKELETLLELAVRLGYTSEAANRILAECDALGKMMRGLITAVKERRAVRS